MIRKLARLAAEAYRCVGVGCIGAGGATCRRVVVSASSRVGVSAGLAKRHQLRRRPPSYHRCVEKQSPSLKERRIGVSACRRAWLVGTRSRAIRRGTSTERAKVKIGEANRKGPQHRKRRTARRPEALYPSFPASCAGRSRFMDGQRRIARERVPTADTPTRRPRRYVPPYASRTA